MKIQWHPREPHVVTDISRQPLQRRVDVKRSCKLKCSPAASRLLPRFWSNLTGMLEFASARAMTTYAVRETIPVWPPWKRQHNHQLQELALFFTSRSPNLTDAETIWKCSQINYQVQRYFNAVNSFSLCFSCMLVSRLNKGLELESALGFIHWNAFDSSLESLTTRFNVLAYHRGAELTELITPIKWRQAKNNNDNSWCCHLVWWGH